MIFIGNNLRKNTILRELWIAHNDLSDIDAEKIAELLKANAYLEFLDISNNRIKVNNDQNYNSKNHINKFLIFSFLGQWCKTHCNSFN